MALQLFINMKTTKQKGGVQCSGDMANEEQEDDGDMAGRQVQVVCLETGDEGLGMDMPMGGRGFHTTGMLHWTNLKSLRDDSFKSQVSSDGWGANQAGPGLQNNNGNINAGGCTVTPSDSSGGVGGGGSSSCPFGTGDAITTAGEGQLQASDGILICYGRPATAVATSPPATTATCPRFPSSASGLGQTPEPAPTLAPANTRTCTGGGCQQREHVWNYVQHLCESSPMSLSPHIAVIIGESGPNSDTFRVDKWCGHSLQTAAQQDTRPATDIARWLGRRSCDESVYRDGGVVETGLEGGDGTEGSCCVARFTHHSDDEAVVWRRIG
jgi:hypothetical protein